MKNNLLLVTVLFLLLSSGLHAQSTNLEWAKQIGGIDTEEPKSIAVDGHGNVFTVGVFTGESDFDPSGNVFSLNSDSGSIFISKLDKDGNFVWAGQIVKRGSPFTKLTIRTDSKGNIYLGGGLYGVCDVDPGSGVFSLGSEEVTSLFILKLNNDGELLWAHSSKGGGAGIITITDDNFGNLYIAGEFGLSTNFDPGRSDTTLTAIEMDENAFLFKMDTAGNFKWVRQFRGAATELYSTDVDGNGNIYAGGRYFDSADLDPGADTFNLSLAGSNYFIVKLDSNGKFIFAKNISSDAIPGSGIYNAGGISGLCINNGGNIVVIGPFKGTIDIDPDQGIVNLTSGEFGDTYILTLDNAGKFISARQLHSQGYVGGQTPIIDQTGNMYISGDYNKSTDFDPGDGEYLMDGGQRFILKLDSLGNFVWVKSFKGLLYILPAVDNAGNIYATGSFTETQDFDPDAPVVELTSYGDYDVFIFKLNQNPGTGISEIAMKKIHSNPFPNPAKDNITIVNPFKTQQKINIRLYSMNGTLLKQFESESTEKISIDVSTEESGIYSIQLKSGIEVFVTKVSVVK